MGLRYEGLETWVKNILCSSKGPALLSAFQTLKKGSNSVLKARFPREGVATRRGGKKKKEKMR